MWTCKAATWAVTLKMPSARWRLELKHQTGYSIVWSGQYENMLRVRERLKIVLPLTIGLIFLLLYANTKSTFKALVVVAQPVPFSLVGAVWLLYFLGYNISIAVWVGMIAPMGLDAEAGGVHAAVTGFVVRRSEAQW